MLTGRPHHQALFCRVATRLSQIDETAVYDLFDLIQAPPTLQSFFHHIPLLPEVIRAAVDIAEISGVDSNRYREAEKTATILNELLPGLQNNIRPPDFRVPKTLPRYGPYDGILGSHPLYSALAEDVPHLEYHSRFVCLKAHLFVAVDSLGHIDQEALKVLHEPFSSFRKLARPEYWPYLGRLPDNIVPANTFAEIVWSKFHSTPFQSIGNIFRIAERSLARRIRKKKTTPPKPKVFTTTSNREDDEDVAAYFLDGVRPATTLNESESEDYINQGGTPDEMGPGVDFQPILDDDVYHGPTRRQLAFQAKQASNRRAMENQFCSLAWNQANLYDLNALFEFLEGSNQLDGFDFKHLARADAILLLGLMLFTCNSLKRILSLPVFCGTVPGFNAPEGVYHKEGSPPLVRLYSPGPDLSVRVAQLPGAFPVEQYVNLPLPEFFSRCLKKIGNPLMEGGARPHLLGAVNPHDDTDIQDTDSVLRRVLVALNRGGGARLSLGRISSYLMFRVAEGGKCDLPGAMLLFGRNDRIARTRIHYTLAEIEHLEATYRTCTNSLLDRVGRDGRFNPGDSVNSGGYLGTPFCPTQGTVRMLAEKLQSAVKASVYLPLAERHNIYTLYTAMLISFGTGFRAIHDPSLKEVEIDPDWGIGVISDKGEVSYRSRYVYLAPVVLEQIGRYRQHIQAIYGQLGVTNPSLFNLVKNLDYEGLPLSLFRILGEFDPVELLAPGVAKKILKTEHHYRIPLNAGRHYLKFRLLRDGCSPELIEAHLGHWENGQEPWGLFSNLDPLDFAGQMAGHLPKIMEEDGWKAIGGVA